MYSIALRTAATLSLAATMWMAGCSPSRVSCFVPQDQTAGWHRVSLPEGVPALAAPVDVDQFRSSERAIVWTEARSDHAGGPPDANGVSEYTFELPRWATTIQVVFADVLNDARVDVIEGTSHWSGNPLITDQRTRGARIVATRATTNASHVRVRVHHHFRPQPVVREWRIGWTADPVLAPGIDASFRVPRSLYYRHPGDRQIELCAAPGQTLALRRESLGGVATPDQASPTAPTRFITRISRWWNGG